MFCVYLSFMDEISKGLYRLGGVKHPAFLVKGKLKTVKVHFSKDVVVNGVNNISNFEDLKKGHLVTIR